MYRVTPSTPADWLMYRRQKGQPSLEKFQLCTERLCSRLAIGYSDTECIAPSRNLR
jgi:hypothetical protein